MQKELGEAWIRDFEERRAEVFEAELLSMQGAHDSLSCLIENGVAVCVASQELVDLAKFFSPNALFSADEVTHGKPHPDVFLHAAEVMGAEPDRCLVIEDSDLGITAALQAGMRVFEYPGDASAERRDGVRPLPSLSEIPPLLGTT